MTKIADLQTKCDPTWCPGCGNFGIWGAFRNAAVLNGWDNTNTVLTAGIGCHSHILNFVKLTSFEGLHGRAIPVATGIKIARPNLNVFVFTGDGDCLGEGGNHFLHACRRNHNLTVILHDNAIYGLTTGQTSPTSPLDFKSKSTPFGNLDQPISPVTLAIAAGATFVARGYAPDIPKLTELITLANNHKGLAVIDVLQPCVTFNHRYTHQYYQANTYYLGKDHDIKNKEAAFKKSLEWGEKQIPLGIFYQVEKPSYEEQLPKLDQKNLTNLEELLKEYI